MPTSRSKRSTSPKSTSSTSGSKPSRSRERGQSGLITRWLRRLVVLAGILALLWFFAVPQIRPPLQEGERYGIDVSHHQGSIDWDAVAGDNISFAYIKATEGGDFVDPEFGQNWREAGAAGLDRGAYHFFTACTLGSLQAESFLTVAPPTPGVLPPAVDLEMAGQCTESPSPEVVANELDIFLRLVDQAWGQPSLIYLMDDWEEVFPTASRLDHPMWGRSIPFRPSDEWQIWQLPPYSAVNGIEGRVDLDVMAPNGLTLTE